MKNQTKSYLLAVATVCIWSTISSASKITLRFISPVGLLLYASVVSTAVLFCILVWQKKASELKKLTARDLLMSFGFGMLNPFLYYLVLFKAYALLPAQQAQIINYTWAISLALLSIPFLHQKVSYRQWCAIALSYCGVLVIATDGNILGMSFSNPAGIVMALLSTVIWALYWILNTRDKRDPVIGLFLNFLCAMPAVVVYALYMERGQVLSLPGIAGAIYIGIFEMGVSFVLWLMALKYTSSTAKIANLIFLAPFISLFFIHHVVGEAIYKSTVIGLVFVLAGLAVQSFGNFKTGTR